MFSTFVSLPIFWLAVNQESLDPKGQLLSLLRVGMERVGFEPAQCKHCFMAAPLPSLSSFSLSSLLK